MGYGLDGHQEQRHEFGRAGILLFEESSKPETVNKTPKSIGLFVYLCFTPFNKLVQISKNSVAVAIYLISTMFFLSIKWRKFDFV